MSKNSFKIDRLIVSIIDNLSSAVNYILVRKNFRGAEVFVKNNPADYLQYADLTDFSAAIPELLKINYEDLEADHKTYINSDLFDSTFFLFQNGISRYLNEGSEYTIRPEGGFVLANELQPGDSIFLTGQLNGVTSNAQYEIIPFSSGDGPAKSIDMTINARTSTFYNPNVRAYEVIDSNNVIEIKGFETKIIKDGGGVNTELRLFAIFGDGYFILTN